MRETIRDFTLAVAAVAALFAAFQSWTTGRELTREMASVREELTREMASVREELAREMASVREELAAEMAALREELAEVRGQLQTITDAVLAHVNAPGLHGGED